jgi:hypothetical protein
VRTVVVVGVGIVVVVVGSGEGGDDWLLGGEAGLLLLGGGGGGAGGGAGPLLLVVQLSARVRGGELVDATDSAARGGADAGFAAQREEDERVEDAGNGEGEEDPEVVEEQAEVFVVDVDPTLRGTWLVNHKIGHLTE